MRIPAASRHAAALLLALSVVVWATWVFRHYSVDDAYISYRIAENIARGAGFVYNPGQRFQVATSPLWALLLAGAAFVGLDVPSTAQALSAALLFLAALLAAALPRPTVERPALPLMAVPLFVSTQVLLLACMGMETSLYLALATAAVTLACLRHHGAAGLAVGLLGLTRLDGLLLAPWLGLLACARGDRRAVRGLVSLAVPMVLWFAFATVYFGTPLPVTLAAKRAQAASGLWGSGAIFVAGVGRWLGGMAHESALYLLVLPLALLGFLRGPRGLAILGAHAGVVTIGYGILDVPDYHWYYAPLVFALLAAAGWGAATLPRRPLALAAILLVTLANVGTVARRRGMFPLAAAVDYGVAGRELERRGDATVAAAEIGVLGYASGRPMCDWLGLACPAATPLLRSGHLELFLQRFEPDVLILHEPLWPTEEPLLRGPEARRYGLRSIWRGHAGNLVALERGAAPLHGAVVATTTSLDLIVGERPLATGLPPFDPRCYSAFEIEALALGGPATLELSWTNAVAGGPGPSSPYRARIDVPEGARWVGLVVPIASDPRFLPFGDIRSVWLRAEGHDVNVRSLALASAW